MRYLLLILAFVSFLSANNPTFNSITYPAHQGNFLTDSRHGIIRSTTCGEWNYQERGRRVLLLSPDPFDPYNSTLQGGDENYNLGRVSTRLVPATESRKQGQFIKKFYRSSPVNIGDNFIVIPIGGVSGYFDKTWRWHEFN